VTADRSAAADTLRDELAEAIEKFAGHWLTKGDNIALAEAVLPVVLRYADAQVAAEREARWDNLIGYRVNHGTQASPDWVIHHPSYVEIVYRSEP
jgi:hypothetical protein